MDNPNNNIAYVISRLLNPLTPDALINTIKKYYYHNASLAHPFFWIEEATDSRERIIRSYTFLRILSPTNTAKIRRQSFNDVKGRMVLELEVAPTFRGLHWGINKCGWVWHPTIRVQIFLTLQRENQSVGPWRIYNQEVLFQPMDILTALRLKWLGRVMYHIIWIFVIFTVLLGQAARLWKYKEFSVYNECMILIRDGYHIWLRQPACVAMSAYTWTRERTWEGVVYVKRQTPAKISYWYRTTKVTGWRYIRRGIELREKT